jgi:hypothetical protein
MPVTELMLQQMRTVAIAGAGLGTAIILSLLQLEATDQPIIVAVYAVSVAIPAWVAAWQYVQQFLVKGEASFSHFSIRAAATLAFVAGGALATAIGALIWMASPDVV